MQGVKVTQIAVPPLPLTESFMAERVDDFGQEQSLAVFEALRDGGALNETGFLISDPRCGIQFRAMVHCEFVWHPTRLANSPLGGELLL